MERNKSSGLFIGIIVVLLVALVACAKPAPAPSPTASPVPAPTTAAPAPAKIVWTDAERIASTQILAQTLHIPMYDEINKRSNGRLEIKSHWSESLVKHVGILEAISKDTVDMAHVSPTFFTGTVPMWLLPYVPTLFDDYQHQVRAWQAGIGQAWMDQAKREYNAHVMGQSFIHTDRLNLYSNKSIPKRPADIKGLKITSFNPLLDTLLTLAGAAPTAVSGPDMYLTVQRGTVDGFVQVPTSVTSTKLHEVIKYGNLMPLMWGEMGLLLVSGKAWASLPPDLQQIVDETAAKYLTIWGREAAALGQKSFDEMKKAGVTLYTPTSEDIAAWRELAKPVLDKFVSTAGEVGKTQLDIVQKTRY